VSIAGCLFFLWCVVLPCIIYALWWYHFAWNGPARFVTDYFRKWFRILQDQKA
jgi:hypothetical protein